jgi:eukaryotic-like serine/threonine-protein kinase
VRSDSLTGRILDGRYAVEEPIGSGGMGTVYRGRQLSAGGRPVAIKVLERRADSSGQLTKRFESEAYAISQLRHPNTLKLIDSGRAEDGQLYIITELLEGEPLSSALARGPLDQLRTTKLLKQVCESLAEAHSIGLVHRDLKPSNIFLEKVGDQEIVKVIDFGIARFIEGPKLTAPAQILGTPAYMSPEQIRGEPADARADLYALGVIGYECLAGRPPFIGEKPIAILLQSLKDEPTPITEMGGPIYPELGALIMELMAKDPGARPSGAVFVRKRLDRIAYELSAANPSVPPKPPEIEGLLSAVDQIGYQPTFPSQHMPVLDAFAISDTAPTGMNVFEIEQPAGSRLKAFDPQDPPTLPANGAPRARDRERRLELELDQSAPPVELDLDRAPPPVEEPKEEASAPPPAPQAAPEQIVCPKCGRAQAPSESCTKCGIMFAKAARGEAHGGVRVIVGRPEQPKEEKEEKPPAPKPQGSFWPSFSAALLVPVRGRGVLWLPILGLLLAVASLSWSVYGILLKLAYVGLLANYFAKSVARGLEGEALAPDLKKPSSIKAELILPGLMIVGLAVLLWGPPTYLTGRILFGMIEEQQQAILDDLERSEGEDAARLPVEMWNPDEVFRTLSGEFIELKEGDDPKIVKRHDRRYVKVYPGEGVIVLLPLTWDPGQPDPTLEAGHDPTALPTEEDQLSFGKLVGRAQIPPASATLVLLLVLFAFYYWPMALTIAALSGNLFGVFNPFLVLSHAAKGGSEYAAIAIIGLGIAGFAFVMAMQLTLLWMIALVLGAIGYLAGVQGYLMGRLVASRPDAFPEVKI